MALDHATTCPLSLCLSKEIYEIVSQVTPQLRGRSGFRHQIFLSRSSSLRCDFFMILATFFHPWGSIFEVFGHLWRPFGPSGRPERFKTSFRCFFFRLLGPFGGPSGAQESPREPQGAQKCSKRRPKWSKKAPKVAPETYF